MKISIKNSNITALSALVAAMLAFSPLAHSTPVTWTLEDVNFGPDYSASGSLTVDSVTGALDSWDITVLNGSTVWDVFSTPPTALDDSGSLDNTFSLYAFLNDVGNMNLGPSSPLYDTSATNIPLLFNQLPSQNSYASDIQLSPPEQDFIPATSGSLVSTIPEPSSVALLGLGLAGVGFMRWRKVS
jgi:hypothetical protein